MRDKKMNYKEAKKELGIQNNKTYASAVKVSVLREREK